MTLLWAFKCVVQQFFWTHLSYLVVKNSIQLLLAIYLRIVTIICDKSRYCSIFRLVSTSTAAAGVSYACLAFSGTLLNGINFLYFVCSVYGAVIFGFVAAFIYILHTDHIAASAGSNIYTELHDNNKESIIIHFKVASQRFQIARCEPKSAEDTAQETEIRVVYPSLEIMQKASTNITLSKSVELLKIARQKDKSATYENDVISTLSSASANCQYMFFKQYVAALKKAHIVPKHSSRFGYLFPNLIFTSNEDAASKSSNVQLVEEATNILHSDYQQQAAQSVNITTVNTTNAKHAMQFQVIRLGAVDGLYTVTQTKAKSKVYQCYPSFVKTNADYDYTCLLNLMIEVFDGFANTVDAASAECLISTVLTNPTKNLSKVNITKQETKACTLMQVIFNSISEKKQLYEVIEDALEEMKKFK